MSGHVFISYGSENKEEADALCALIESRGVTVWIAPRDVRPGLDYSEALQSAIESCGAFVVLVTEMANKSPYVRAETEMAFSNSKPIFPVRMSDIKPAAGLAFFLKIRHWTDAYGPGRQASLERLAAELQSLSGVVPGAAALTGPAPAPAPAAAPPAPDAPPADEELLTAAIGPRSAYYLQRWRAVDAAGARTSWNWAACFASVLWLAYRKMWLAMALFVAANLALGVIGSASVILAKVTLIGSILLSFVTGYFGNLWYRAQVSRLIAGTAGLDRAAALAQLKAKGGVSRLAVWIWIGTSAALVALAVAGALMQQRLLFDAQQEQLRQQHLSDHQNQQTAAPAADDGAAPIDSQPAPEQEPPPAEDAGDGGRM
jgi:heme exporter protein D